MEKESDVFLVDHAWTFRHRNAWKTLMENENLVERLEGIIKYTDKRELPMENPYKKKARPSLQEYMKKCEESTEPVLEYDLDEYDIKELKDIKFREEVQEISLWSNQVHNPNDVTEILMKLPNLKACWLNDNPVEKNCSNFNIIGGYFDKLEIFNSKLTSKAADWAMLFYARDTGAKTMEEITTLDLTGKNLL